jgi:hypothetical protein
LRNQRISSTREIILCTQTEDLLISIVTSHLFALATNRREPQEARNYLENLLRKETKEDGHLPETSIDLGTKSQRTAGNIPQQLRVRIASRSREQDLQHLLRERTASRSSLIRWLAGVSTEASKATIPTTKCRLLFP